MIENWERYLDVLRSKWGEIPLGSRRWSSAELNAMSDEELLKLWEAGKREQTKGADGFSLRGWYHELYKPLLKGKKVLDVGSGAGVDGISFAQTGSHVTFLDIVESNLQTVKRLCEIQSVRNVEFAYLEKAKSIQRLANNYDVIWCQGSQITAPFELMREEDRALLTHMKSHGRWIELGYPKTRWEREGRKPFEEWGTYTDGGAPWIEWYDLEKILRRLEPAKFKPILYFEFHNSDFNWVDLLRDDD